MKHPQHTLLLNDAGSIIYDGSKAEIEATQDYIQVNCTKIEVKALRNLLDKHTAHFGITPVILQTGSTPNK